MLAIFAALLAFSIFHAATADVTPSEAWNYDRHVGVQWQESLRRFDANNHVFITLLERISTRRFHLTELSLRLPALLGGVLYLWAVFRLSRRWFTGAAFVIAALAMAMNPLVIDALSEARGYGFAMAFWLWALELVLQCLEEFKPRKLTLAAMCLAGSVAACLAFVVPVLGLMAVFGWLVHRPLWRDLYLPLLIFLFVLLAIPMNRLILTDLAQGTKHWPGALWVVGAALLAIVVAAHRKRDRLALLPGGTALISLVLLLLARRLLKMPYPDQGAIYFVPIGTLTLLAILRRYPRALMAAGIVCLLIYAALFPAGAYREGREFAGSRDIAKALRADVKQRTTRIATSLELEPVMNYYRSRYRQGNWERIERKPLAEGYEYYVLTTADSVWVERLRLHVIRRTPGIILAAR